MCARITKVENERQYSFQHRTGTSHGRAEVPVGNDEIYHFGWGNPTFGKKVLVGQGRGGCIYPQDRIQK
ncbi:MAG: hypothetical protein ACSHW7_00100 [Patiriisocius sp.]|uniref:hypothetical protein n=1 Tax=Patiriisocius sp. TaxID=2822396 RepID=UPI003EF64EFB